MKRLLRSLAGVLGVLLWAAAPVSGGGIKEDFDGNGVVDLGDFFLFADHYGQTAGQPGFDARFDIIGDGRIDAVDYNIFVQNFGARSEAPASAGPLRTFFYVADYSGSGVSVIDAATNLVLSYIPFRGPSGIAISPDQRTAYFVDLYAFLALREDFNVDYTLPLNVGAKVKLSPDGRTAFVTQEGANNVLFIDLDKKVVSDTVVVGRAPLGISVSPDGKTLYVVNTGAGGGVLSFVDVPARTVRDSLALTTAPGHIIVSPDGRRGFLNSGVSGTVTVVDLVARKLLGGIQTGGGAVYGMAFSPDGKRLYATASGKVIVIDPERNLIADRISLGDDTGPLTVSPDGSRLYVSAYGSSAGGAAVYIVDLNTRQTLGKIRGFAFPVEFAFRASAVDIPLARRNKPAVPPDTTAWGRATWRPQLADPAP